LGVNGSPQLKLDNGVLVQIHLFAP
jgi:hypothetical protein